MLLDQNKTRSAVPVPWTGLISIVADSLPVTTGEAIEELRAQGTGRDLEIKNALEASADWVERRLNMRFRIPPATYRAYYPSWPTGQIRFDWQPVPAVTQVAYYSAENPDGPLVTVDPANYYLIPGEAGRTAMYFQAGYNQPNLASRNDVVQITYSAGYLMQSDLPPQAKRTILTALRYMYGDISDREYQVVHRTLRDLLDVQGWGYYR